MSGTVKADPLFLGLTRPPMLFGVSYNFMLMSSFICLVGFIATVDFRFFMMMGFLYIAGLYICSKEPLFIELFMVKSGKCSTRTNTFYHGANSYDQY